MPDHARSARCGIPRPVRGFECGWGGGVGEGVKGAVLGVGRGGPAARGRPGQPAEYPAASPRSRLRYKAACAAAARWPLPPTRGLARPPARPRAWQEAAALRPAGAVWGLGPSASRPRAAPAPRRVDTARPRDQERRGSSARPPAARRLPDPWRLDAPPGPLVGPWPAPSRGTHQYLVYVDILCTQQLKGTESISCAFVHQRYKHLSASKSPKFGSCRQNGINCILLKCKDLQHSASIETLSGNC